jgi:cytidylate kinase
VFIYAPFEERVRRLRSTGKSEKEAFELAQTVDQERADFARQYFDIEWPDRHRFHLMVNSGMGEDAAVETILDAVTRYSKHAG